MISQYINSLNLIWTRIKYSFVHISLVLFLLLKNYTCVSNVLPLWQFEQFRH